MVVALVLLYTTSQAMLLPGFVHLEEQLIQRDAERIQRAFDERRTDLEYIVLNWDTWDEAYTRDSDAPYAHHDPLHTLNDIPFDALNLSVVAVIDPSGQIINGAAFDANRQRQVPLPASLAEHLTRTERLLGPGNQDAHTSGILMLPEAPLLIATRTTGTRTLLIGRLLDEAELQQLETITNLPIEVFRYDAPRLPTTVQRAQLELSAHPMLVQPIDNDRVAGYVLLHDLYGNPALIARTIQTRSFYQQERTSLNYFYLAMLGVVLTFALAMLLALDTWVLGRLAHLSERITHIGQNHDFAARFHVNRTAATSRDELTRLAHAINGMLDIVEHSKAQLSESNNDLEQRVTRRTEELARTNTVLEQQIIERRQAEHALQQKNEYLAALHDTALTLMHRLDINGLLETIIIRAAHLVGTPHGYVYLLDAKHQELELRVGLGRFQSLIGYHVEHNTGLAGRVWHSGDPLVVNNYATWEGRLPDLDESFAHAAIGVPLVSDARVVGVVGLIYAETDRHFGDAEAELLQRFAHLASIALDNAYLYSAAQREVEERVRAETALRHAEEKYRSIFERAMDGIFQSTPAGYYLSANPALARMYGYDSPQDLIKHLVAIDRQLYVDPDRRSEFITLMEHHHTVSDFESQIYRKDGSIIWIAENVHAVHDATGNLLYFEGFVRDITDRKNAEDQLLHNALHDELTALPNRTMFIQYLEQAIKRTTSTHSGAFAVLFLDTDHFKTVNDSLGHSVGDQMLLAIAQRLRESLRVHDIVARLGGDEFAILLDNISDPGYTANVADRIQHDLSQPFYIEGHEVFASVSIGITSSAVGYLRAADVLRDADTALHQAKELGRGRYEVFDTRMHTRVVTRLEMGTELRRAIEREEFRIYYQPIVSLHAGTITGFEALIRWQHPQHGLLSPAVFLPVADEIGLITTIDQWVLYESCRQLYAWQQEHQHQSPLTISVNVSGKRLAQSDIVQQVSTVLDETGLAASSLHLEITENSVIHNAELAIHMLQQLRDLGVHVSLDDFGTGYSSLSYLHRFPINILKIDRSFINNIDTDHQTMEVVRAIVTLAHNLGMEVIAEGAETLDHLNHLRSLRCEYGQGYYFSRPVDTLTTSELLRNNWQRALASNTLYTTNSSHKL